PEYLRSAQVTGVYDDAGRMVAGYIVNTAQPLRLVGFVPPEARATMVLPRGASWDDCAELTCAWKRPGVPAAFMARRFWLRAHLEMLGTRRRWMLGHAENERLDAMYTKSGPRTLYAGPSVNGLPSRLFAYGRLVGVLHMLRGAVVETLRRTLAARKPSHALP